MRAISFVNELYGHEWELKVAQRRHARFVNTTMMVTGLGAAVSDALADGRVVSGVGGQYNFVAMAHALPGARSMLCARATRIKDGKLSTNIVTSYGHVTIPRHLRDIAITEYGTADLRGRTDAECIAAMINIADSRFQEGLLKEAKRANKVDAGYRVPEAYRHNTPERLENAFAAQRRAGLFSEYPFGTDLTRDEIDLARALRWLKEKTGRRAGTFTTIARALFARTGERELSYLDRLGLRATPNEGTGPIGLVLMCGAIATLLARWGLIPRLKLGPRNSTLWGLAMSIVGVIVFALSSALHAIACG
jgi:hypothetical protein